MRDEMYEVCPICEDTWYIKRVRLSIALRDKEYCCDRCGFHARPAATWYGARRNWNRIAKAWRKGFEECKPMILKNLEMELKNRER